MITTRPPYNERIYAPYKIAALVEVLSEQGVPPVDILRGTNLHADQIYDAGVLASIAQYATVCRNAVSFSGEPDTPFKVGMRLHLSAYGMYGYALMSCLSLREYFELGVRYHRLATPTVAIRWVEYPDKVVWTFPDLFVSSPSRELREFMIEQQYMQHVTHLQDVAGSRCPPVKACFSYPAPAHADLYFKYLECQCFFDQPECELIYDSAILERKPQLAHKLTATLLRDTCDRLIGQAKTSSGVAGEVYQILMSTPSNFAGMEAVARRLNITTRTLRRRLESEGTSFLTIVDDARSSLALEYLKATKMSTDDVATLLGFSDAANFRRALKRWTGKGPRELRRKCAW
ncbi:AraC family transcriptional regulator [Caballeronia sp. GAFFF1]|uniref:AraC family transcriptional regulator n=1 Tax=Caballeronia sp. GAFFF1 TaxID=2921779 RepID=UPI00202839E6